MVSNPAGLQPTSWSLLGNMFPIFAYCGLVVEIQIRLPEDVQPDPKSLRSRFLTDDLGGAPDVFGVPGSSGVAFVLRSAFVVPLFFGLNPYVHLCVETGGTQSARFVFWFPLKPTPQVTNDWWVGVLVEGEWETTPGRPPTHTAKPPVLEGS